jgi:hypothetical protein
MLPQTYLTFLSFRLVYVPLAMIWNTGSVAGIEAQPHLAVKVRVARDDYKVVVLSQ